MGRAWYGQNYRGRLQYVDNYRNDFRRGNFKEIQNYGGQHYKSGHRNNYRNNILEEVEVGPGKDSTQVTLEGMIKAVVDQDQAQEPVPTEIELDV